MQLHLVIHRDLLTDGQRYQPWREALARAGISLAGVYDLADQDWPQRLAGQWRSGDRLVALGGDGTVSSVAQHSVERQWPLAVLPAGTANDFARGLAIPTDPDQACRLLQGGVVQKVDVGRLNGRVFLNVAHIGLGAQVALSVSPHKRLWGPFSYLWRLLRIISGRRRFWARIETDERTLYGRWLEIAVANGHFFGGGHVIDGAGVDTGTLTLVAVRARALPKVILAWLARRLGRPLDRKLVRVEHVKQCRISTRRHLKVTADGELFGVTPVEYLIEPRQLPVVVPPLAAIQKQQQQENQVLDQQHDVMLYAISGRGSELAERYRDLAGLESLDSALSQELLQLADQREQLMDALNQEILAEGGLPKAGNPDREFIESLTDRWLTSISGPRAAFARLQEAEQLWLDDIVVLSNEQWSEALAELLIELSQHGHRCQERLVQMADHC